MAQANWDTVLGLSVGELLTSDVPDKLSDLRSLSAGPTEPAVRVARQLWYDETADMLKIRAGDNASWITMFDPAVAAGTQLLQDGSRSLTAHWDVGGYQIKNLAAPTVGSDAARLSDIPTLEAIQDDIANVLTSGSGVSATYDDALNTITLDAVPAQIDHAALANLTVGDPHTQYALADGSRQFAKIHAVSVQGVTALQIEAANVSGETAIKITGFANSSGDGDSGAVLYSDSFGGKYLKVNVNGGDYYISLSSVAPM